MNRYISNIFNKVVGSVAIIGLWSCSAENPFDNDGQGVVQLRTVVNSITTRADSETEQTLEEKCVVYISSLEEERLVYKKLGLHNVDSQITLKAGPYVAEAWTGDSVTASFNKKFYRGYQPFDVTKGSTSNVVVNCRIANVVASINTKTINPELMKDDYVITIRNTRGELEFTKDNAVDGKAYFMMPNDDNKLEYTISGTRKDGKPFNYEGVINDVERAHHYILSFEYNPSPSENSGGYVFIKINIKDEEIKNDNVTVFTRPTITGVEFDIENQLIFIKEEDIPQVTSVQICGDGIDDITLAPLDDCGWKEILGLDLTNDNVVSGKRPINFAKLESQNPIITLCKEKGIEFIPPQYNEETKIETAYLNFSKELFLRLTESDTEHKLKIYVSDQNGQESTDSLCIARAEAAIKIPDPIIIDPIDLEQDRLSVRANSVNLKYKLSNAYEGVPGVEYSKANEDNWTFVAATSTAYAPRSVMTRSDEEKVITITGLEPNTTYKYRACCGDFHSKDVMTFTTETTYTIPNASLEEWSSFSENSKVLLPGAGGERTFWDSGNHGSSTMNVTLTQGSTDMFHSGEQSAKLRSQFVGVASLGKFAAGNLFAGTYKETKGTNGVIEFGRPYDGSHPSALSVWANYRPGVAKGKGANATYMPEGATDQAQIYVAIATSPVKVDTSDEKTLFNPEHPNILGYGQITLSENFGPDGQLQHVNIPITYNDNAKTNEAKYLIIVCSASKYGDYFCGGEGSTMYLDDFELIYE